MHVRRLYPTVAAVGFVSVLATGASAQSHDSIADVGLEDLMQVEVTSVAKREQPLQETPAAVFVLTGDDIRRVGATTLAELLRGIPGLDVSRAGASRWAVSARGFNSQYANKMQVLVDGRSVYSPLFSGVYWDSLDLLPEDIERIEVIRGPGAAMWGANAVNGVVNIITRSAAQTQGHLLTLSAGGDDRWTAGGRTGGQLGERGYYRIYARDMNRSAFLDSQGQPAGDAWELRRGGGRVDFALSATHQLMVQADIYAGRVVDARDVAVLAPPFLVSMRSDVRPVGGHVLGRWTRQDSPDRLTSLVVFWDRTARGADDARTAVLGEVRQNLGVEWQRNRRIGRHRWTFGADYRRSQDEVANTALVSLVDASRTDHYVTAFAQNEVGVAGGRWRVTLGTKVGHNPYTGGEFQPSARLAWVPDSRFTAWSAVSRAIRRPSRADDGVRIGVSVMPTDPFPTSIDVFGSEALSAEVLIASEAGARWQPTRWWSLDMAGFVNRYSGLIGATAAEPTFVAAPVPHVSVPLWSSNAFDARSHGLEVLSRFQTTRARAMASYSYLSLRATGRDLAALVTVDELRSSPSHQASLRTSMDIGAHLEANVLLQFVGPLDGGRVPAHTRADLRLGWRPTSRVEIGVGVRNALTPRYVESLEWLGWPRGQVPRRAYTDARWWF